MSRTPPTLGQDHFKSQFHVSVRDLGFKSQGDDGRKVHDWDSAEWFDTTIYNGILDRIDGRWQLQMQWVDLDNNGHKIVLPHQVVEAIIRSHSTIMGKSRSEGAKKAHQTRLSNGTVSKPFLPKG